jgi:uncharacterized membrane protein YdbT with pleckstrin-like domain
LARSSDRYGAGRGVQSYLDHETLTRKVGQHPCKLAVELLSSARPALAVLILLVIAAEVTAHSGLAPEAAGLTATWWVTLSWLRWSSASLTVTNLRIVLESGVFKRTRKTIALDRIQSISIQRTVPGRLLGYGTIEIGVAGQTSPDRFRYAPRRSLSEEMFVAPVLPPPGGGGNST